MLTSFSLIGLQDNEKLQRIMNESEFLRDYFKKTAKSIAPYIKELFEET